MFQLRKENKKLTVALWHSSVPLTSRRAEESRISFQDESEVAHEPDHVAESVVLQVGKDSAVFRSIESRTHFADAGLIDTVGVAISESGF